MREIKFRAWDMRVNKWYESVNAPFKWYDGFDRPTNPYIAFCTVPEGVILQQFTGIKDANGKEIYEGDILHSTYISNSPPEQWVVKISQFLRLNISSGITKVVVGNMYENPELYLSIQKMPTTINEHN